MLDSVPDTRAPRLSAPRPAIAGARAGACRVRLL